ncbi:MAG: hypothetical protein WCI71_10260 [Bacteroidota bacterium]
MKWITGIFILQLILGLNLSATAQEVQFSSSTQLFIKRLESYKKLKASSLNEINELKKEFAASVSGNKVMIGAMLKVNEGIDMKKLKKLGVEINTNTGGILSARIPVYKLGKLKKVKGLVLVDVDLTVKTRQ